MRKAFFSLMLVGALLGGFSCTGGPSTTATGFHIGNLAPGFNLFNLSGEKVSLESFRPRPAMVNFWATD